LPRQLPRCRAQAGAESSYVRKIVPKEKLAHMENFG
jgi:hypothetical protein